MTKDKLFDVSKDIVLITGVAGQLGGEYAKTFLMRGSKVFGLDLKSSAESDALTIEYPGQYIFSAVDVTNKGELQQSLKKVESTFGTPTVLINNAAIDSPPSAPPEENGPFEDYPEESWDKVIEIDFCVEATNNALTIDQLTVEIKSLLSIDHFHSHSIDGVKQKAHAIHCIV